MKYTAAIACLLGLATAVQVDQSDYYYSLNTNSYLQAYYNYGYGMWYTTTYHAGPGPYYDTTIFTSCDDTYHYEETGFNAYFSPYTGMMFQFIDGNGNDLYWMEVGVEADVLDVTPYKQAVWWQRGLSYIQNGNPYETHAYAGGAYEVIIGNAYVFWGEEMAVWGSEVFDALANSNAFWQYTTPAINYNMFDNSWADPYTMVDLTDYVINNVPGIGDYVGAYEIYQSQLF